MCAGMLWCRRQPRLTAEGWFQRDGVAGGMQQQEPGGILHSLSDFLDTMGSGMAALGLFSQVCRCYWHGSANNDSSS